MPQINVETNCELSANHKGYVVIVTVMGLEIKFGTTVALMLIKIFPMAY